MEYQIPIYDDKAMEVLSLAKKIPKLRVLRILENDQNILIIPCGANNLGLIDLKSLLKQLQATLEQLSKLKWFFFMYRYHLMSRFRKAMWLIRFLTSNVFEIFIVLWPLIKIVTIMRYKYKNMFVCFCKYFTYPIFFSKHDQNSHLKLSLKYWPFLVILSLFVLNKIK